MRMMMSTRRWLLAATAFVALGRSLAEAPPPTPWQHYQLGLEAQTVGDYDGMLAHWRTAAAAGAVEAQEMLAMALLVGPSLYGPAVARDVCEAGHWMREAAARGSLIGYWQVHFFNRLRNAPGGKACADR